MDDARMSRIADWLMEMISTLPEGQGDHESFQPAFAILRLMIDGSELENEVLEELARVGEEIRALDRRYGTRPAPAAEASSPPAGCRVRQVYFDAGPCVGCGAEVGNGAVGWCDQPRPGPLCDPCLTAASPELAATLGLVHYVRQCAHREVRSREESLALNRELFEAAQRYARASAAWALRPMGAEELFRLAENKMQERHGMFWLDRLKQGGGDEPN